MVPKHCRKVSKIDLSKSRLATENIDFGTEDEDTICEKCGAIYKYDDNEDAYVLKFFDSNSDSE